MVQIFAMFMIWIILRGRFQTYADLATKSAEAATPPKSEPTEPKSMLDSYWDQFFGNKRTLPGEAQ